MKDTLVFGFIKIKDLKLKA